MPQSIRCPGCGNLISIPRNYNKERGKCPSCNAGLDLTALRQVKSGTKLPQKNAAVRKKTACSLSGSHLLIQLTEKYAENLKKYGIDLQKIYSLIRKQIVHKKEFEKQKSLLRNEIFTPLIKEIIQLPDFSFTLRERIELWYIIFDLLPYILKGKDPEAVFNIYPRYEYAGIVGIGYVLSGYDNAEVKREILLKTIRRKRTTQKMKQLFQEVLNSPYKDEFIRRTRQFLEETREISKRAPAGEEHASHQIEEDFNFGFSWVAFYLPPT